MMRQPDDRSRQRRPPAPGQAAERIVRLLQGQGFAALLAGGCVRDMLRGRPPKDYDVATNARPEDLLRLFRRTLKVGVQFGVVIVGDAGPWIEVATFRSDVQYSDGRHPDRVVFSSAQQDALRRDFTINGLFYDPLKQEVIDYVGGRADLDKRIVRAIGSPDDRFAEDHLRLLRAVRFAAVLDFTIEPQTWQALLRHAPLLANVSRERVLEELSRMLSSTGRATGMRLLHESGLLPYAIPAAGAGTPWPPAKVDLACARLAGLPAHGCFALGLAAALADWPEQRVAGLCRQMACSNELRKGVTWLIRSLPAARRAAELSLADLKRLMASRHFEDLKQLTHADALARRELPRSWQVLCERSATIPADQVQPEPLVDGNDLLALGVRPGPIFSRVLDAVYTAQLNEQVTRREHALEMMRQLLEASSR